MQSTISKKSTAVFLRTILFTATAWGLFPAQAVAFPVVHQFTLTATSGSQFGAAAPVTFTGSFAVDSTFLEQADGDYAGSNISGFFIAMGSQTFSAATAFDPNIQGVKLVGHKIVGIAMNFSQTNSGLRGPYIQASTDGTWESGSTVAQDGALMLRGSGQNFSQFVKTANLLAKKAAPVVSDGEEGSFFVNANTGELYGPKTAGASAAPLLNLSGQPGPQGPAGAPGPVGPAGAPGPIGPTGTDSTHGTPRTGWPRRAGGCWPCDWRGSHLLPPQGPAAVWLHAPGLDKASVEERFRKEG